MTQATDAIAEAGPAGDGRGELHVPYVPYARRFYLPQWVAFDANDNLLTGSLAKAEALIGSMQRFMQILMGFAVRRHVQKTFQPGRARTWGAFGAGFAGVLSAIVFIGQIVGKWEEGGWVVLISFSLLVLAANAILISPIGRREPRQIHRIVREKARVQGAMASIVEWQSLRMQEYRYDVLVSIARLFELVGVRRPARFEPPAAAGDYDHALHVDHPEAPSLLQQYLENQPRSAPHVGGQPKL